MTSGSFSLTGGSTPPVCPSLFLRISIQPLPELWTNHSPKTSRRMYLYYFASTLGLGTAFPPIFTLPPGGLELGTTDGRGVRVLMGWVFLIPSCSTELMRRVRRFQIAQYKCLVIKYAKDTRYSTNFSTHDR